MPTKNMVSQRARYLRHHQRGLTLIEFMISITIGLVLLTGMVVLMARQSSTQAELEKASRQIENGRYAAQLLQQDIQLAGYWGEFTKTEGFGDLLSLPNPCVVDVADLLTDPATGKQTGALQAAIQGYDSPATLHTDLTATACALKAANHLPGTDLLVVRRVESEVAEDGKLKEGVIYFQTGMTPSATEVSYRLASATSSDIDTGVFYLKKKDGTSTAPLRKLVVHIYFISPCSVPKKGETTCTAEADGGTPVPTLKRLELSAGAFEVVPLVEGIENMQLDYGLDADGDGAPDNYATNPTATDWPNVMAVRVHLLARNNERTMGYQDNKTYSLGLAGDVVPADKGFKRRVFSQVIRVVNSSARRES